VTPTMSICSRRWVTEAGHARLCQITFLDPMIVNDELTGSALCWVGCFLGSAELPTDRGRRNYS
jgi:hypothetical protein